VAPNDSAAVGDYDHFLRSAEQVTPWRPGERYKTTCNDLALMATLRQEIHVITQFGKRMLNVRDVY
jgi:hypothetical protein